MSDFRSCDQDLGSQKKISSFIFPKVLHAKNRLLLSCLVLLAKIQVGLLIKNEIGDRYSEYRIHVKKLNFGVIFRIKF